MKIETIREDILEKVIHAVIPSNLLDSKTKYFINPTGRFVVGGPQGDCGLTGRKIIVDTYGGVGSHGGGAFSGKDPTKVDRSASYMARHIAKNIVAAGLADRLELQIAYAIGVAEPVSVMADTQGTGKVDEGKIVDAVREIFPLTPKGIIEYLNLRRPIYKKTAAYGHFGRNEEEFTWERTDKADALRGFPAEVASDVVVTRPPARVVVLSARPPGRSGGAVSVVRWRPRPVVGRAPADGYVRVSGVVHVHTTLSDGAATPDEVIAAARAAGLKFVVITDHNNLDAKQLGGVSRRRPRHRGDGDLHDRRPRAGPGDPRSRLPLLGRRARRPRRRPDAARRGLRRPSDLAAPGLPVDGLGPAGAVGTRGRQRRQPMAGRGLGAARSHARALSA